MNLNELYNFKLSDAIHFHRQLNPAIFDGDNMNPKVRQQLLVIAEDFIEHLGINNLNVKDITLSGSNAAYTYTKHSDIDLHILVDMNEFNDDDVYREFFHAKKTIYNDEHNIKIKGFEVELYVQDTNQPVISLGEYSVLNDKWLRLPRKRKAELDQTDARLKYEKIARLADYALKSDNLEKILKVLKTLKKYRQAGLDFNGEFGPENLAFKALRSQGVIKDLYARMNDLHSKELSIPENRMTDEDYDPNGIPPGPEFKPTMPKGTVRVDVSDVYDWYKLGQHISNMKGLGKHDFGKGPPSTIFSFGSEDQEHKYIDALAKTGLTTTDIDPKSHKKLNKQKVDTTFNVNEVSGYIPSEKEKNDPRFKTALSVDVKPDSIKKNAKAFGFKTNRAGIPPLLRK
jgi:hypothetical protein